MYEICIHVYICTNICIYHTFTHICTYRYTFPHICTLLDEIFVFFQLRNNRLLLIWRIIISRTTGGASWASSSNTRIVAGSFCNRNLTSQRGLFWSRCRWHGEGFFVKTKEFKKNPYWRESRSLTIVLQLLFACALILRLKVPKLS